MGVLFQLGITVSREHFTVGINIDALVLGLLQELFQIKEIMSGNDNKRPFLHSQTHFCWNGITIGFRISLIQQLHAFQINRSDFQDDREKFIHPPVLHTDSKEGLIKEVVYFRVRIAQDSGVIRIGGHTPDAKQNQRLQRANILLGSPQMLHAIIIVFPAG